MARKTNYQAGDQSMLRQINLSAIMNYIRVESPISRSMLAKKTGLNKATITSLVGELIQHNFIQEVGLETNGLGRPSMKLRLNPTAGYIIGTEIGVDFINVIGADFSPRVIFQSNEKTPPGISVENVLHLLTAKIHEAIEVCAREVGDKFLGLALGVPGLVDYAEGVLLFAPNLKWTDVPLKKILSAEFSAPVFVDNEANLATFGEFYFGSAYQHPDMLYLSVGVGLGGGILHNTHLLRGVNGMAGELGHITMQPDGELCGCGNRGCWETLVSLRALYRTVELGLQDHPDSVLLEWIHGNMEELNLDLILQAARQGDLTALESLEKIGHSLGIGIASLLNTLNPDIVVFGGIMSDAWDFLEPVVTAEIRKRALPWNQNGTQVVLAQHGGDACVMGGVATVYRKVISQRNNE
jgi:glucokinase-like ROK family protein